MQMVFRWFGEDNDHVNLKSIRQIPDVKGVVWSLHDLDPGEDWPMARIEEMKSQAAEYNLHINVVESVNVHEDIKLGSASRDKYIDTYIENMRKLSKVGVKVICYNFMPIFDWVRTDLYKELDDGSTALFYEKEKINKTNPMDLVNQFLSSNKEFTLPGWEPERLGKLAELFEAYKDVDENQLFENFKYFMERIIPVAEETGIKMALHPDDPPYSVFGLPRIVISQENIRKLLKLVDHPHNGITLCSGSLGVNPSNNIPDMIYEFKDRIHFAHIRNIKHFPNGDFIETSHKVSDGSLNILAIVKAFHDIGYEGYTRPDHGRHIWNEICRPGYGLYDRALGIMYIWGIWDTLKKEKEVLELIGINKKT